jgi:hypothetical protein
MAGNLKAHLQLIAQFFVDSVLQSPHPVFSIQSFKTNDKTLDYFIEPRID